MSDRTMDDTPVIDDATLKALEDIIGAEKVRGFVLEFVDEARGSEQTLRAAWARLDQEAVYRPAHNLVATAGNFGTLRVSRLADDLQQAARQGDAEAIPGLIDSLSCEIERARAELQRRYAAA